MKKLDFIIVGAQKAGTTSYARYLCEHTSVFIPREKELPFFTDEAMYGKGYEWFYKTYFSDASDDQLIGTSTPQYMFFPESFQRIHESFPQVKLIAILRDPIRRLISHYDMSVRIGNEQRGLNEAVEYQLNHLVECRLEPYKNNKHVVAGEYSRSIENILKYFDQKQLMVIDFKDIVTDRQRVLDEMCHFLGITPFVPLSIDKVEMKGGRTRKIDINHDRFLAWASSFVRKYKTVDVLVPNFLRRAIINAGSWMDMVNVDSSSQTSGSDLSEDLRARLEAFYEEDKHKLERLGYRVSWGNDVEV